MKLKFTNSIQLIIQGFAKRNLFLLAFSLIAAYSYSQTILWPDQFQSKSKRPFCEQLKANTNNLPFTKIAPSSHLNKKANMKKLDKISEDYWTGTAFPNIDKTEYTYDANGRLATELYTYYDEDLEEWVKDNLEVKTRDSKGNIIKIETSYWNSDLNKFELFSVSSYTFNSKNAATTFEYSEFNETLGKMVNVGKQAYTYNSKDLLTMVLVTEWNNSLGKYENSIKNEYTYDSKDLIIQILASQWKSGLNNWQMYAKRNYQYDANKNNTYAIHFNWNVTTSSFDTLNRSVLTYDSKNNVTMTKNEVYNQVDKFWDILQYDKNTYTYDASGNKLIEIISSYDSDIEQFLDYQKIVKTFDSKNNSITETLYEWDDTEEKWMESERYDYVHDNNYVTSQLVLPMDDAKTLNDYFKTKLDSETYSTWDNTKWAVETKTTFTYSDFTGTGKVEDLQTTNLILAPNPAHNQVEIKFPNSTNGLFVKVSDVAGKLIISKEINSDGILNIQELKGGIYFVQLYSENKLIGNEKLIKQD